MSPGMHLWQGGGVPSGLGGETQVEVQLVCDERPSFD